jgi:hypothetical protein
MGLEGVRKCLGEGGRNDPLYAHMNKKKKQGGEMTQALYAHMNNKTIKKVKTKKKKPI